MGDEGFYSRSDAERIIAQYQSIVSELDEKTAEWEKLVENME